MSDIPLSIAAYLEESGYTATELLVLKHSLSGDPLTLRELAARTGKSTGVLSQATKKLVAKNILTRETINASPKYLLRSLDAIRDWIEQDVQQKKDELKRRCKDMHHYIDCIHLDATRPKMEFYEGEEGIEKAFMRLLELHNGEILQWLPVQFREEDDPLYELRSQQLQIRKKRNIELKTLAHDTPLGRRYQDRDVFSERKTKLLPVDYCPILFEKIIVGDTIVCINMPSQRASFIHYPELAELERLLFLALWRQAKRIPPHKGRPIGNDVRRRTMGRRLRKT